MQRCTKCTRLNKYASHDYYFAHFAPYKVIQESLRSWIPRCVWILDSSSVELRLRTPKVEFQIRKPKIPDLTSKRLPGLQITLHGATH